MLIPYLTILFTLTLHASPILIPINHPRHETHDTITPPLTLHDSRFRIAVFADLHFGEDEDSFGIAQDINSTLLMDYVLEMEQPHLAILNGDLITGENTFRENSTKYIDRIVEPLVRRGIPWASTYGNHDSQFNLSRQGIFEAESKYRPLAMTQKGPENTDGLTNYALKIHHSLEHGDNDDDDAKPAAMLWFFDSRGGGYDGGSAEASIPGWVSNRTAAWYRNESAMYSRKWPDVQSLAFVHIPIHAFRQLQDAEQVSGPSFPGLNADVPLAQQGDGDGGQAVDFTRALLEHKGLHSIYSGHDHGDSWCGTWPAEDDEDRVHIEEKPFLCFCKHSGFGGYGKWNRGVRIVELRFADATREGVGMEVATWARMQDGKVVTSVVLNSTYGRDQYPTADGGDHPY